MFFKGRNIFHWRFVSRSDTPKFRKWFSRLLCKDYQGKLTTLLESLHNISVCLKSYVSRPRGVSASFSNDLVHVTAVGETEHLSMDVCTTESRLSRFKSVSIAVFFFLPNLW